MNITPEIEKSIKDALTEDIQNGDITTLAIVSGDTKGRGEFIIKQNGTIVGFDIVEAVFKMFDPGIQFKKYFNDGDKVVPGDIAGVVEGNARSLLTVERTALNFFQRMSGIATYANKFVSTIEHTRAKILDTRKTAPGLRAIDKLAVKLSGCTNHRTGLYDMFLIKDNHIAVAGSITKAVDACKKYQADKGTGFKIEVETTNLDEVKEALRNDVDFIMLDNFNLGEMKKAVELINGRCRTEASGMVNLNTVKAIAETGVDFISIGALTHSVTALDISLEITTD